MQSVQSGYVKFFNSQKGYGFIIPSEPIDGHAEVFVHHTVIHNSGGFKSLAENEPVEFGFTRGPKGLQATRVTGPGGSFVRGDPFTRLRNRPATGTPVASGVVTISSAGAFAHIPHYPLPTSYSRGFPYGAQPALPHYSQVDFGTLPPLLLPPPGPPPPPPLSPGPPTMGVAATRQAIRNNGLGMVANGTMADLHGVPAFMAQCYGDIAMPVPTKYHGFSAAPGALDGFGRRLQDMLLDDGIPASFASPSAAGVSQAALLPSPVFPVSGRPGTRTPLTSVPSYASLPD
ncbi:hypothetical protein LPJ61_005066 [Coemansia biformis]|uniref:CSD domain-containing protein n=1 Tax=Coemansia biformis TaxID=1286918 RepID=A0A9W7Y835_9FUNG|nr:hypothetical protein LPJ61_005066 [Coemansia biformis]